ncbi:MAG: NUDIX domain-containing protein [Planctomycetes bacterium]|nr:NUDIX domain-containing protein [Planctomycetota bacterium]
MIPFLKDGELEELVSRTYRFCYGYLSGPLYLTRRLRKYLSDNGISCEPVKKKAGWQTGAPELDVVFSRNLEKRLAELARGAGRKYFESNLEAAYYVCQQRTRAPKKYPIWGPEVRRERVATLYIVDPCTKQFLLMFHRNLGAWLAPGGHVELGEGLIETAVREAEEEIGVSPEIADLHGYLSGEGKHFRCVDTPKDSPAFCTVEEFIEPIGGHDPHIHVDAIIVGFADSRKLASKRDASEVATHDWFLIDQIEQDIETFDNVPAICRAILSALD